MSNTNKIACAIALIAAVSISATQAAPQVRTPVPLTEWDGTASHGGWTFAGSATTSIATDTDGSSYVAVTNRSAGDGPGWTGATFDLPLSEIAGDKIWVTVLTRARNVSQPAHSYNGVKAMVHMVAPGRPDTYDEANGNGPTFPLSYDWKPLSFQTAIPKGATSATLILGLQESTGEADFKLPVVKISGRAYVPHPLNVSGPVYTGHGPGALRGVMIDPKMGPDDIAELAKWHVNLVRWQLLWDSFPNGPANTADYAAYDKWLWSCLGHLDDMLPYFKKAGITVLIDMHTAPGGRDSNLVYRILTDAEWQDRFGEEWDKIARKYRGNRQIWGYDLVNEPMKVQIDTGLLDWRELAEQTAKRVRAIDRDHAIVIEPDPTGVNSLTYFEPLDVPGIVYSVHMYDPGMFTGQGAFPERPMGPIYPGIIGGVEWNKDQIRKDLSEAAQFAKDNHVQIYIGEFSAIRWAKGADKYLADVIDVLEENHWDWSYHAFREWQGWSLEVGDDKSVTTPSPNPTARMAVLRAAFDKNLSQVSKR